MKESRYFYVPDAATANFLPEDEAQHCLRVLRLKEGDELMLMDGQGTYYRAVIEQVHGKKCYYRVLETLPQEKEWSGWLHLAVAPTKNLDRMEWLAEKATEIGVDELSFLLCRNSERKVVKTERMDKILVSAMKQSHKSCKPVLGPMCTFRALLEQVADYDQKFIAHCYDERDIDSDTLPLSECEKSMTTGKQLLFDLLQKGKRAVVLVGPEGDFSIDEVRLALQKGFLPVSLGKSRLRTETAALVAVHMMQMKNAN